MNIQIKSSFSRDLKKSPKGLLADIVDVIDSIEAAKGFNDLKNVKNLKGSATAYRISIANYRLCFFLEDSVIILVRFLPRKDVYKFFP
jgi:mRNA interferase RelE/StbE